MSKISIPTTEVVTACVDALKHQPGALLPILHSVQNELGYIPKDSIPLIASALHQTPAEIHGVISFYHLFRTQPPGNHKLQVCRAEACQARGSRTLESHIKATLKIDYHQTTLDNEISLEPVYCLGNCACGPSLRIDNDIVGQVTTEKFDRLYDDLVTQAVAVSKGQS